MFCKNLPAKRFNRINTHAVSNVLSILHQDLYHEYRDFGDIDVKPYLDDVKKIFYANPVFNNLSSKYELGDFLMSDGTPITQEHVEKYLYIYIYMELLYQRIRNSKDEKDKLYSRINHLGSDNNFFGYIKLYTVCWATKFVKSFKSPTLLKFFSCIGLKLNIIEAVMSDILKLQFKNALVGTYLSLTVPVCTRNFRKDEHENILCDFDEGWVNLYTSWNIRFTYSGSPGKNYFPRTSVCLWNSYRHKSEWLNNRAYVLFASHVLKTSKQFNEDFGLDDIPNKDLLKDWDTANISYMIDIIRSPQVFTDE